MIDLLYQNVGSLRSGVDDLAGSMKQGTDVTKEMAQAIQDTPEQKFQTIKQQIHNNVEELAGNLLPTVNEVGDKISGIIQKGSDWIANNQDTVQSITRIVIALTAFLLIGGGIMTVVGTVGKTILSLSNTFKLVRGAVNGLKSAFTIVKTAVGGLNAAFLASPITWIIAGIAALIAIFILLWNRSEAFRSFWLSLFDQVRSAVLGAWQTIKPSIDQLGSALMSLWEAIQPVIQLIEQVGAVILVVLAGVFMGALQGVVAAIQPLMNALINIVNFITNVVRAAIALFSGDFSGAMEFAGAAVDDFVSFFTNGFDAILSFLGGFADGFLSVIDTALSAVGINASDKIAAIKDGISSGLDAVKGVFSDVMNAAGDTVKEKLGNIKNAYEENGGGIQGIAAATMEGVKGYYTAGLTFVDNLTGGKLSGIRDKFNNKCNEIKNKVSEKFEGIKSTVGEKIDGVRDKISTGMKTAKTAADNQLTAMRYAYAQHGGGIQGTVAATMTGMQSIYRTGYNFINNLTNGRLEAVRKTIQGKLEAARATVTSIFESIRTAIQSKLDTAAQTVRSAIDRIKSFFRFDWSLPRLKMPTIDIQGKWSMNPPSVPKFSVKWNAEGGILNKPQIFGKVGQTWLGGGEAGQEAVLPLTKLWTNMRAIIQSILDDNDDKPDDTPKNAAQVVSNFITQKVSSFHKETVETRENNNTVNNSGDSKGGTTIYNYNYFSIYPKMSEIKDWALLQDMADELKDAANNSDPDNPDLVPA